MRGRAVEPDRVGLAIRAGRKVIDEIVDGLKFHSWSMIWKSGHRFSLATNAKGVCAEIVLKQEDDRRA